MLQIFILSVKSDSLHSKEEETSHAWVRGIENNTPENQTAHHLLYPKSIQYSLLFVIGGDVSNLYPQFPKAALSLSRVKKGILFRFFKSSSHLVLLFNSSFLYKLCRLLSHLQKRFCVIISVLQVSLTVFVEVFMSDSSL